MKRILILLTIISITGITSTFSQNRSIVFHEKPWAEIQAMAKKEKKLIFMDAYAVWCGPCKWMAANIFTNDTVADFYNKNFICTKFDMEKGEGLELRSKYEVKAYPTLLFIDGNGEMVHKRVGAPRQVKDYIAMGTDAITPGKGLGAMMKKYNGGYRDPRFLADYLQALQDAYSPTKDVLASYFAVVGEAELTSQGNWNLIYRFTEDMNSREFVYLLKNQARFAGLHTADSVNDKINEVYLKALMAQARSRNNSEESYNQLKTQILNSGFAGAGKAVFTADLNVYLGKSQTDKFLELAYSDVDRYFNDDYNMLNTMAWQVYSMTEDPKYLERAAAWAKRSVELESKAFNNDTYANILYRLGKKELALGYAQAALDLAKKENLPLADYEASLKKMKAGE